MGQFRLTDAEVAGDAGDGHRPRVVVVGGGIAGLAAARRLTRLDPDLAVTLVERDDRLGGKVVTEQVDGFVIEGGPDSFLSAKPRGLGLCDELGIADRLAGTTPRRHRAFVLSRGRLHELPEGLTGLVPTRFGPVLRSRLLSPRGKARLALDAVLPARPGDEDEAVAAFVRRRLGSEVYDRLVEPLLAGIYAGDGDRLSLAATFPQLRAAERSHGGLIRGLLAAKRAADGGDRPARPPFVAPEGGLGEVVDALVDRLRGHGARIVTGATVREVRRPLGDGRPGFEVVLESGRILAADAVVLATPAYAAGAAVAGLDPTLAGELRAIPHASTAIVALGFRRSEIAHPLDGHGYLVPRIEARPVLGCTWTSQKWAGRAPAGFVLMRVFVGRFGQDEALARDDRDLVALVRAELGETLGVTAEPALTRVQRWPWGMPQYVLGHRERLGRIEARLRELPGLTLAGNAYRGVGLPDCIASGEAAAEAAVRALRQRDRDQIPGSHVAAAAVHAD